MKILVTGGAGFIGSAVIRYLLEHTDDTVVNVDALTYAASPASLEPFAGHSRYVFEHVNICDAQAIASVFSMHQPDAIMHLAAETHVDRSIDGPAAFIQSNIVGTYTLLEAARVYWAGLDPHRQQRFRFHHVSTDEVFGDLDDLRPDHNLNRDINRGPDSDLEPDLERDAGVEVAHNVEGVAAEPPHRDPFTEHSPYRPSSPYSASKAASDHLVRAWARTYGLPVLISHCSNNYGPWQYPEKLIPLVIRLARDEKPIPIYGDGLQIRDWLYVDDHASALGQILKRGEVGQTYNVSASEERSNLAVVHAICDHLDRILGDRQRRRLITHVADRPGHDRHYALDASRLKRELAWQPLETFESGLLKTVQWYVEHGFERMVAGR